MNGHSGPASPLQSNGPLRPAPGPAYGQTAPQRSTRTRAALPRGRWIPVEISQLASEPGTYAIFRGPRLLYLGSASDLQHRLSQHFPRRRWRPMQTRYGPSAEVTVRVKIARRFGDHARSELRLIQRLRPPLNRRLR